MCFWCHYRDDRRLGIQLPCISSFHERLARPVPVSMLLLRERFYISQRFTASLRNRSLSSGSAACFSGNERLRLGSNYQSSNVSTLARLFFADRRFTVSKHIDDNITSVNQAVHRNRGADETLEDAVQDLVWPRPMAYVGGRFTILLQADQGLLRERMADSDFGLSIKYARLESKSTSKMIVSGHRSRLTSAIAAPTYFTDVSGLKATY